MNSRVGRAFVESDHEFWAIVFYSRKIPYFSIRFFWKFFADLDIDPFVAFHNDKTNFPVVDTAK